MRLMGRFLAPTVAEPDSATLKAWMGEGQPDEDHTCDVDCCTHDHDDGECDTERCDHDTDGCSCACEHADCCSDCHSHDEECCEHEHDGEECCSHPYHCECTCDGDGDAGPVTATDGCALAVNVHACEHGHPSWLRYFGLK